MREYYSCYEGEDQRDYGACEQKISDDSEEQFADILVRRMRGELERERSSFLQARLVLAIVSVAALVMLFGMLVLALLLGLAKASDGASIGLGWAFIIVCWVLACVNYTFNQGSKQKKNSRSEQKINAGGEETGTC